MKPDNATAINLINRLIQTVAMNYATLTAGRCIAGVGTGILSSTAPMYISEVAPPNIRGALLVLEQFAIVLGIVVMYFIVRNCPFISLFLELTAPQDLRNSIHRKRLVLSSALSSSHHTGSPDVHRHLLPSLFTSMVGWERQRSRGFGCALFPSATTCHRP